MQHENQFAFIRGDIVPIDKATVNIMTHALHYGTACFAGLRSLFFDLVQGKIERYQHWCTPVYGQIK